MIKSNDVIEIDNLEYQLLNIFNDTIDFKKIIPGRIKYYNASIDVDDWSSLLTKWFYYLNSINYKTFEELCRLECAHVHCKLFSKESTSEFVKLKYGYNGRFNLSSNKIIYVFKRLCSYYGICYADVSIYVKERVYFKYKDGTTNNKEDNEIRFMQFLNKRYGLQNEECHQIVTRINKANFYLKKISSMYDNMFMFKSKKAMNDYRMRVIKKMKDKKVCNEEIVMLNRSFKYLYKYYSFLER